MFLNTLKWWYMIVPEELSKVLCDLSDKFYVSRRHRAAGHPPYAYASSYVDRVRFDGDLMGINGTPVRSQRTTAGSIGFD